MNFSIKTISDTAFKTLSITFITMVMYIFSFSTVAAQGAICSNASPFCGTTSYQFPGNTGNTAPSGPDYGCMVSQPNPVWYYMQVDQPGTIGLTMGGGGLDIDFAMWGPFPDQTAGCQQVMNGVAPIQSSYSSSSTENIGLGMSGGSNSICSSSGSGATTPPAAQAGQVYIVMISNYTGSPGTLSFNQTSGSGSTNCAIVNPCSITNVTASSACNGANATISGSFDISTTITTGTIDVTSSCGGSQTFNPPFPTGLTTMNYSFNGGPADGSQCTITVTMSADPSCSGTATVIKSASAPAPVINTTPAGCTSDGVSTITNYDAAATYTFTPTGPTVDATGLINGAVVGTTYTVFATLGTCTSSNVTFTNDPQLPIIGAAIFTNPGPICSGATFTLPTTSTNGISGTWTPAINNTETTTYTFSSNPDQCTPDTSITVVVKEAPIIKADPMAQTICSGESVDINITSDSTGVVYGWVAITDSVTGVTNKTGSVIRDTLFYSGSTSETVTYAIIGTKNGCSSQPIYVTVTVNPAPTTMTSATLSASPTVVEEGSSTNLNVTLSPYVPGIVYSWIPTESLNCTNCPDPIATPTGDTWYTVKLTTPEGCNIKDSIFIKYKIKCGEVYVPNIFSPNQDGNNDVFKVYSRCMVSIELSVFDRWGNRVFFTNKVDEAWDGSFNGKVMNSGTYIYRATVSLLDGTSEDLKGTITLVR